MDLGPMKHVCESKPDKLASASLRLDREADNISHKCQIHGLKLCASRLLSGYLSA